METLAFLDIGELQVPPANLVPMANLVHRVTLETEVFQAHLVLLDKGDHQVSWVFLVQRAEMEGLVRMVRMDLVDCRVV